MSRDDETHCGIGVSHSDQGASVNARAAEHACLRALAAAMRGALKAAPESRNVRRVDRAHSASAMNSLGIMTSLKYFESQNNRDEPCTKCRAEPNRDETSARHRYDEPLPAHTVEVYGRLRASSERWRSPELYRRPGL